MSQVQAPLREMALGQAGLMAEPFGPEDIRSVVNPTGKLFFGRIAAIDGENKAKHPTLTTDKILGVVMHSHALESKADGLDAGYGAKETANVIRKGYVWVVIEEDIIVGDAVFYRHAAGAGGTKLGALRNDADTASCTALPNARWVKGGTAVQGIALLEVNVMA